MEKQGHLLGLLIQERRQKQNMALGELAHASGTTATEIKQYELGKIVPDAGSLVRVARALAVEPAYFCDHDVVCVDEGAEVHPADPLTVTRLSEAELETLLLIQWQFLSRSRRDVAVGQVRALLADQQREDFARILDGIL